MKLRKCLACGTWFEAYHGTMHLCDACEAEIDENEGKPAQIQRDMATRERIEAGAKKRLEGE